MNADQAMFAKYGDLAPVRRYEFTVTDEYGEVWSEWVSAHTRGEAMEKLYDRIELHANPGYRFCIKHKSA